MLHFDEVEKSEPMKGDPWIHKSGRYLADCMSFYPFVPANLLFPFDSICCSHSIGVRSFFPSKNFQKATAPLTADQANNRGVHPRRAS